MLGAPMVRAQLARARSDVCGLRQSRHRGPRPYVAAGYHDDDYHYTLPCVGGPTDRQAAAQPCLRLTAAAGRAATLQPPSRLVAHPSREFRLLNHNQHFAGPPWSSFSRGGRRLPSVGALPCRGHGRWRSRQYMPGTRAPRLPLPAQQRAQASRAAPTLLPGTYLATHPSENSTFSG